MFNCGIENGIIWNIKNGSLKNVFKGLLDCLDDIQHVDKCHTLNCLAKWNTNCVIYVQMEIA